MPKEPKPRAKNQAKSGDTVTRNLVIGMVGLVVLVLGVGSLFNSKSSDGSSQAVSAIEKIQPASTEQLTPEILPESDYGIVFNKSAKPAIDIWEDFQCPYCGQFEKAIGSYLEDLNRGGGAKISYHMVSFLGQESVEAANAAYCTVPEGRFLDFHKTLYAIQGAENSGQFTKEKLVQIGKKLGISSATFEDCVNSGKNLDNVKKISESMAKYNVNSTPTVFINGKLWRPSSGQFNLGEFQAAVEAAK